jgi:uncharacterized protein YndB with AHSA1/START domain
MRHLEATDRFPGPIERVYDLAIDPAIMPSYMPWISDVTDVSGRGDRVGDSFRFTDHRLGRAVSATCLVTEAERPVMQRTETAYEDGSLAVITMHFRSVEDSTEIITAMDYRIGKGLLSGPESVVSGPFVAHRMREMSRRFGELLVPTPA